MKIRSSNPTQHGAWQESGLFRFSGLSGLSRWSKERPDRRSHQMDGFDCFAARGGFHRVAENKQTAGHGVRPGSMARIVIPFVPGDTFQVLPRTAERGCVGASILVDLGTARVPGS